MADLPSGWAAVEAAAGPSPGVSARVAFAAVQEAVLEVREAVRQHPEEASHQGHQDRLEAFREGQEEASRAASPEGRGAAACSL